MVKDILYSFALGVVGKLERKDVWGTLKCTPKFYFLKQ
jgi:hypothetical protein